jgi:hypothetical protein
MTFPVTGRQARSPRGMTCRSSEGAGAAADVAACRVMGRSCGTRHRTEWESLRGSTRANSQECSEEGLN